MQIVKWAAYAAFGLAVLGVIMALGKESPIFFAGAVHAGAVGVFFMALARIIELLAGIKAALLKGEDGAPQAVSPVVAQPGPVRSVAEIAADIERLKAKA